MKDSLQLENLRSFMGDGSFATKTGNRLEETVKDIFAHHGFTVINYREWERAPLLHGEELLLLNAPYTSIYGHKANMEFLVRSKKYDLNLRIECKWQQVAGSVDEKFPYLYLNCVEAIEENDIIIIYGGKGQKQGAIDWLKNACEKKLYNNRKKIAVFDLDDFLGWVNKKFK